MLVRRSYLENRLTLANSGTRTMDLNYTDPISHIMLTFRATNGATSNKENPVIHNITKIEVVDGGDVITSIRGEVLRGLVAHLQGHTPLGNDSEAANEGQMSSVKVPFGRYDLDTDYAFNPTAFRNPQLKVTWDLAHIRAIGATAYVTGTLDITAVAVLMEDVSPPTGVLTAKEIYDFTSAASGDERVDMPTDYPWRTLLVRGYENGTALASTITNLKLSADGGKFVAFDEVSSHILEAQLETYGELDYTRLAKYDNANAVATYMAEAQGGTLATEGGAADISAVAYWWKSDAYLYNHTHAGVAGSAKQAFFTVKGTGFENCFVIPMGRKEEPTTWFPAQQFGSVDLYITQGDADAEVQVAVQEARPY
jgi:hypothetical protein